MEISWLKTQNTLVTIVGLAAGLFTKKGHGIWIHTIAKLAIGRFFCAVDTCIGLLSAYFRGSL